jgi:hypothetical protein
MICGRVSSIAPIKDVRTPSFDVGEFFGQSAGDCYCLDWSWFLIKREKSVSGIHTNCERNRTVVHHGQEELLAVN